MKSDDDILRDAAGAQLAGEQLSGFVFSSFQRFYLVLPSLSNHKTEQHVIASSDRYDHTDTRPGPYYI